MSSLSDNKIYLQVNFNFTILCIHVFPLSEQFFVDVGLPVSMVFESELTCNSIVLIQGLIEDHVTDTVITQQICRRRCSVHYMTSSCDNRPLNHRCKLKLTFEVRLKNPSGNAVSPQCNPLCQRQTIRQIIHDTALMKHAINSSVISRQVELRNQHNMPHVNQWSFEHGVPKFLCSEGQVFTNRRLCGEYTYDIIRGRHGMRYTWKELRRVIK